ncbi:hypothetical protein SCHPADRAFT_892671 [Schizopora paradoxa]|uniref:Uncharacterized protein n=1 Tax=Schizopora paradoxa TaxID=27342 RepID=A0A0H2RE27_9AGAM|nr:hypothetical protein SCHPADRAFT_892671 [Schizopora paradoxa]
MSDVRLAEEILFDNLTDATRGDFVKLADVMTYLDVLDYSPSVFEAYQSLETLLSNIADSLRIIKDHVRFDGMKTLMFEGKRQEIKDKIKFLYIKFRPIRARLAALASSRNVYAS